MQLNSFTYVFFVGAGGIGMSALARYFMWQGKKCAGYDRTRSPLTDELTAEGMALVFGDEPQLIPADFNNREKTLVVITPAISASNRLLNHFRENNFTILKRADVLGHITSAYKTIAVAGTHGKTTVSTMCAHVLNVSAQKSLAILGGISKNYKTNFLIAEDPEFAVTEADEYDRSFLKLNPWFAVITAADADHLDIYGTLDAMMGAFAEFASQVHPKGLLLMKNTVKINTEKLRVNKILSYSAEDSTADVYADNPAVKNGRMHFDMVYPEGRIKDLQMQSGGKMNLENALAAVFIALQAGVKEYEIRKGLATFSGIVRRFDVQINSDKIVYVDDYAHHPEEIRALVEAVRITWPGRKVTGIFQPHLFSRTRDLAEGFAKSLELLDVVILTGIYPAREEPVPGVNPEMILDKIRKAEKQLIQKDQLINHLKNSEQDVLLTIGAGDIDRLVEPIRKMLKAKYKTDRQV
ncbi:MAG: UDP-N-acetylmuramate--L-alanine ligase [Bacteroidales bacterium]